MVSRQCANDALRPDEPGLVFRFFAREIRFPGERISSRLGQAQIDSTR